MLPRLRQMLKTLSVITAIALGLSGCAFKSIIYERLDWVVMYQLDSYLDMDKAQKAKFKPVVSEAIVWLKREKVPGAIATFEKLEAAARSKNYNDTMSLALTNELERIRVDLVKKYEAPIASLLLSLSDKQIQHMEKKFRNSNENLEDVLEEDAESEYKDLLKKQRKTLKEYYGELSSEQDRHFYENMRLTRELVARRLTERKRMQSYIVDNLKSRDRTKILAMIASVRDHGEVWQDKDYVEYRRQSEKRWSDYLAVFHKSLSDEQWIYVEGKLREFRHDLMRFIGREP